MLICRLSKTKKVLWEFVAPMYLESGLVKSFESKSIGVYFQYSMGKALLNNPKP